MYRRAALSLAALTASTPAFADCFDDSSGAMAVVPCEYPPYALADYSGAGGDTPATAATPVNDILHRVTIPRAGFYTDTATCNDGSPAVMHVRAALTAADEDKWVIVLEGGGAGFDATGGSLDDGMWDRWTGVGSNLNWIQKTSTDYRTAGGARGSDGVVDVHSEIEVGGIFDSTNSEFAGWNWVHVNYCSSDQWAGRVSEHELPTWTWVDGAGVTHEGAMMDFNGHYIVEAATALLRRNFAWGTDADATYEMPDIDDASIVLVAGESAGGAGVVHNLDNIALTLTTYNPGVTVVGSIGANLKPRVGVLGADSWYVDNDGDGVDDVQQGMTNNYTQMTEINGFLDATCQTNLGDWQCLHLYYSEPELGTRHMIKQDMTDWLIGQNYGVITDFRDGIVDAFDDLEARNRPYFGPDCGNHESLAHDSWHYNNLLDRVDTATGAVVASGGYNDALWAFVNGTGNTPHGYAGLLVTVGADTYEWTANCPP